MPVTLSLTVDDQQRVVAQIYGALLCEPAPLAGLPPITSQSNPYRIDPAGLGQQLFAAMGGGNLANLLRQEADDDTLYLDCDEAAATIPWEYAYNPDNDFLVATHCVLRLLPAAPRAVPAQAGPLQFLALAADPLVDEQGTAVSGPRLDIEHELQAIEAALHRAAGEGKAILARRVPPTAEQLRRALVRGPALLHLSCHGSLVPGQDKQRPIALLALEDPNGRLAWLRGDWLANMPPKRGLLRLVVISACQTALAGGAAQAGEVSQSEGGRREGGRGDANLARALVYGGAPAAIGMQGNLPDRVSDEFAANLYSYLLEGHELGVALRMARNALRSSPDAIGLPVAYIAPGGDAPLPLIDGPCSLAALQAGAHASAPPALQPPKPLYGREADLYALACAVRTGQEDAALERAAHDVVTVVGTGGIGKTALTAAFVQRFGWRFPGGVAGATLATLPGLSPHTLLSGLLARLAGRAESDLAALSAEKLAEALLEKARSPGSLLWIDNYESMLQCLRREADNDAGAPQLSQLAASSPAAADQEETANAAQLHRLLAQLAAAGVCLLLTSREQPAGFAGEAIFPAPQRPLDGVGAGPGAELFFAHSPRAAARRSEHQWLAEEIARQTEGHPLAIMLLGGEYHSSEEVTAAQFAASWAGELAGARREGLAEHHVTFEVALRRSLDRLTAEQQAQLVALSLFPAPFFAEGAALLWQGELPADQDEMAAVQHKLARYTQASLLRVDGWHSDDTPATYRFDPSVQRTLQRRLVEDALAHLQDSYAAYAAWLVNRAFGETRRDASLAQLLLQWLDELERLASLQPDEQRVRYCWQLGVLLRQFGRIRQALAVLALGEQAGADHRLYSRLLQAKADLLVIQGELTEALRLYKQCIELNAGPDEEGERSANLHAMATVYVTRGDLDKALELYQQSLAIDEKLGDIQGRSATLSEIANVYAARRDWEAAERYVLQSNELAQTLGDVYRMAFNIGKLGQIAQAHGDLVTARERYEQALALHEHLGMPEANQVRAFLRSLAAGSQTPAASATPVQTLTALTRAAGDALAGKTNAESLVAAIEQALAAAAWNAQQQAYLAALAAVVRQPGDAERDSLAAAAPALGAVGERTELLDVLLAAARLLDDLERPQAAVDVQQQAVDLLRAEPLQRDVQEHLSILLYNLAGFLANAGRLAEAVQTLEEVVALDERWQLADLHSDRQALAAMRQRRDGPDSPGAPAGEAAAGLAEALRAQMAQLPPEQRAQAEAALAQFEQLSPAEQQAVLTAGARAQMEAEADTLIDAALEAAAAHTIAELLPKLENAAAVYAEGEAPDSPYAQLAQFARAVAAHLAGAPPLPVPPGLAERFASFTRRLAQKGESSP